MRRRVREGKVVEEKRLLQRKEVEFKEGGGFKGERGAERGSFD